MHTPPEVVLLRKAWLGSKCLTLYRGILQDPCCQAFLHVLDLARTEAIDASDLLKAYHCLVATLADEAENAPATPVGDTWQDHLLNLILRNENPFSRQAEFTALTLMGASLREAASHDLRCLQFLFQLDASVVRQAVSRLVEEASHTEVPVPYPPMVLPTWENLRSQAGKTGRQDTTEIRDLFARSRDWGQLLPRLAGWYASTGVGIYGQYQAFRWVRQGAQGELQGISTPDPIRLQELIGYQSERAQLIQNTEQFLQGYPANNVLLYGDRGTGKSSTVKALLNEYGQRGLRLIEVSKHHLTDFPELFSMLRNRRQKFILFVDDLSFEDNEVSYKDLKAILEGGLEARPDNVLIYATSNRRHLVKERFADRQFTDDEVRKSDTLQEKLSLSDRFGITVIFPSPDQEGYLAIVEGLARQRGLSIHPDDLRQMALQWELWHNGRSGRTARQFIDHLTGELAIKKK